MACDSNDEIINTLYKNYYEDDKSKSIPCVQEEETIACNLMKFIYNDKMLLLHKTIMQLQGNYSKI